MVIIRATLQNAVGGVQVLSSNAEATNSGFVSVKMCTVIRLRSLFRVTVLLVH